MTRRAFTILFLSLFLSSCLGLKGRGKVTPELKIALIRVSGEYLDKLNNSTFDNIHGMIIWDDYLDPGKNKRMDKEIFIKQVAASRLFWKDKPGQHPLVNLDLEDIRLKNDDATVKLRKFKQKNAPTIEIKLRWNGQGWLVIDDNIFGKGRLMEELMAKKA